MAGNAAGRNGQWGAGNDTVNQKFTGKERDAESGLDYFGARYYGSALGRFTSTDAPLVDQDTEDPRSWNLYAYVRNSPLTNIDPTGEDCVYTGSFSSTGTVGVERGGIAAQSGGTYFEGTIDTGSLTLNSSSDQLNFNYTNGNTIGSATIGNVRGPSDNDDISPFGAAVVRSLGARTDASYQLMGVFAAGSLVGGAAVANGLAVAGSGVADGIISQTSQYLSKAAARSLAQRLAASAAQATAAAFILAASEVIDLTPLDLWPEGEELLKALWDASFEGQIQSAGVRVASALVGGKIGYGEIGGEIET